MGRRAKSPKGKAKAKRPLAGKSPKDVSASVRGLEKRLAESLEREKAKDHALTEAWDQQTATSEILRVISSSLTSVQPVFDAIVRSAARLCEASDASLYRVEGENVRCLSNYGRIRSVEVGQTREITRGTGSGRAILERRTISSRCSMRSCRAPFDCCGRAQAC